jgi:hypothetical protein
MIVAVRTVQPSPGMLMRAARHLILTLIAVGAATTAHAAGPSPDPSVFVYDCDNLATITGRQFGDRVELSGSGLAPMVLRRVSDDPATFADTDVTVRMTMDYLRMSGPMGRPVCRRNLAEDARSRGIEFRATGSEPERVLEYDEGAALTFVSDGFPPLIATRLSATASSEDRMSIAGSDRGCGRTLPSGKLRAVINRGAGLSEESTLSIQVVGAAAGGRRLVLAEWQGPIGRQREVELDYDPLLIFGDERFVIETSIRDGSRTRRARSRPLVITWGGVCGRDCGASARRQYG